MIASETFNAAVAAAAAVSSALIAAFAYVAVARAARQNRDTVATALDTGNGHTAGQSLSNIEKLTEVLAGQVHDISKRVDSQGRELGVMHELQDVMAERQVEVKDRLEAHLDAADPLATFVVDLMERDQAARLGEIERRQEAP